MPFNIPNIPWQAYRQHINDAALIRQRGYIDELVGLVVLSRGPSGAVGDLVHIMPADGRPRVPAEIVGFRGGRVILMPLGDMRGIAPGSEVISTGKPPEIECGDELLGRVLDGLGNPIDGRGPCVMDVKLTTARSAPNPITRKRIATPLETGVKVIDGILTWGRGQRIGVFSGSGVGKSTLMGMIARNTAAEVNVICLCGERGRELREFIEKDLGDDGLARSVLVIATSDQPALVRVRAPFSAITIAEYFRDKGRDVMFMMDSVTRLAMAQREVGLAAGEPPTTRGYTPSVFAMLPSFLERSGTAEGQGSITGLFTVLVEGDDMNEPIADAVRGILDGHIVLSRQLAARNLYPSVDILQSISRAMVDIVSDPHLIHARRLVELVSTYRDAEDLINIGAYQRGSNPAIDLSMDLIGPIESFIKQAIREKVTLKDSIEQVHMLAAKAEAAPVQQGNQNQPEKAGQQVPGRQAPPQPVRPAGQPLGKAGVAKVPASQAKPGRPPQRQAQPQPPQSMPPGIMPGMLGQ